MKVIEGRILDPQATAELRQMLVPGYNVEELVAAMRVRGLSKIDSIKFLREFAGIPLPEGKAIVHLSAAWADRHDSDEALHDAIERAAETEFRDKTTAA